MDCPHLLHLGFLLLALAAPQPNIGMPTAGPAGGTEDYYIVADIYRCRDCNSCKCENGENNFEKFEKIADAKNKALSDVAVEVVTNKTHIIFYLEEPKSCLQGTYGVFWQKPEGSGLPCGIPSPGGGGISSETICCESETDTQKHNPVLNCFYTPKPRPKLNTTPAGTTGNPDGLGSSNTNGTASWIGIVVALVFGFLVGFGARYVTMKYHMCRWCVQACRKDGQSSEEENVPLEGTPSRSEETSLPAASSSSQDAQQPSEHRLIFP